jgi:hypothetical protein
VVSFHAWERRLRLIDLAVRRHAVLAPSSFLPFTVRAVQSAADEPRPIEADLRNGIRLRIPTTNGRRPDASFAQSRGNRSANPSYARVVA